MAKTKKSLIFILFLAFIIRFVNLSFPPFSSEEARIAFRGHVLATEGKDELGRISPFLFNSSFDYQLPLTSYVTAFGIKLFGKNDFGARLPFIVIGTIAVYMFYLNSKRFLDLEKYNLLVAFLAAFSPTLIFLSKTPNESILLIFLFSLLFQLLTNKKINSISVSLTILVLIAASKIAWFILLPFVVITVYLNKENLFKQKIFAILFTLVILIITFYTFLLIPQSKRSLMENHFTLLSDQSILTSINRLRGQGIEAGWSLTLERILFNKLDIGFIGILHHLRNLSPNLWFSWFDTSGKYSFILAGLVSKILLVPFLFGIYLLLKNSIRKLGVMIIFLLVATFPSGFVYPDLSLNYSLFILPLLLLVSALGLMHFRRMSRLLFLLLVIFEAVIFNIFVNFQITNTNDVRPVWPLQFIKEVESKKTTKIAMSDDIIKDFVSFYKWNTNFNPADDYIDVIFPYKIGSDIKNIYFIGSETRINECKLGYIENLYLSERDYKKIEGKVDKLSKQIFKDSRGKERIFHFINLCLQEVV